MLQLPSRARGLIFLVAVLLLASAATPSAHAAEPDDEEMCLLTLGEDAGVHRGSHAPDPRAFVGGTLTGDTHRYWLKFDLSALPDNLDQITGATLELTAGRKSRLEIGVAAADDDWDALTLDWASQPAFEIPTAIEDYSFVADETYTWDVTDHVAFEMAQGDPLLSLVLLQVPEGARTGNVWFHTHVAAAVDSQRPRLCIRYTVRDDDAPPEVTVGAPLVLARPRHDMRRVELADLATAFDEEDGVLDLQAAGRILSVTSNEPQNARRCGDGNTAPDIRLVGPAAVELRAERAGRRRGRTYRIVFAVADSAGNETEAVAEVRVPHDRSRHSHARRRHATPR